MMVTIDYWPSIVVLLGLTLLVGSQPVAGQHDDYLGLLQSLNDTYISNHDFYPLDEHESRCHQMDIPFCENVGYNKTMLPNSFGHSTLQDIIREINAYDGFINCSSDLRLFLCTAYAPICFDNANGSRPISFPPCRSLCESVQQGCALILKNYVKFAIPALHCDKYPVKSSKVMCFGKDEQQDIPESPTRDIGFVCPRNFEVNSYAFQLNGKTYNNCAMPCDNVYLNATNTQIVRLTVGILAIVCLISTFFTCVTFLVDIKRFKYPARPIIIIAFCQLMVATCYIIGFVTSNKISCNDPVDPPKSLPNMRMIRTTTMGNRKGSCTLQFMALYFFQMSTMFWWLMMTVSWHMIARLKWAPEAVSSEARYFHLVSWTVPALLTIYLSVLGNIEGDQLTGTCYVSINDQESIRPFVIYPTLFCLVSGCVFLASGFKSLWDSQETLRTEYGKQTDEHDKLVVRIGLFSLLFVIFTTILLYCLHHEFSNLNLWMLSWLSHICKNRDYSIPCPTKDFSNHAPHYGIFILKYLATMALGIISALFMLSEKTLAAYREVAELSNYKI